MTPKPLTNVVIAGEAHVAKVPIEWPVIVGVNTESERKLGCFQYKHVV